MMKESLQIQHFGPLSNINLEDIRPLTAIIGPSGSGKSTIIKILALFRWLYKMHHIRAYLKLSKINKSPFRFQWKSYERNNGWKKFTSKETYIVYRRGDITISLANGKLKFEGNPTQDHLHLEKICFIADNRIASSMILAKRMRSDNFYLNETVKDFELAMKNLTDCTMPYFNLQLLRQKSSNGITEYRIESTQNKHYNIPFTSSSSGIQSILPLVATARYFAKQFDIIKTFNSAVLKYVINSDNLSNFQPITDIGKIKSRRVCLHIEEPELSLSPEKQTALLNALVETCFNNRPSKDNYDMGIIFTTHSPYLINQINLLIHAHEKDKYIEGASIDIKDVEVLRLSEEGTLISLKAENTSYIDTMPLSDEINRIYDTYDKL